MLQKIRNLFKIWSERGMYLPMAYDGSTGKPSITLLAVYLGLILSILSLLCVHFTDKVLLGTVCTLTFYVLSVVFYMLRNLQKAKFDLDDKSFELEGEDDSPNKE